MIHVSVVTDFNNLAHSVIGQLNLNEESFLKPNIVKKIAKPVADSLAYKLRTLSEFVKIEEVFLAIDSEEKSWRTQLSVDYKANRKPHAEKSAALRKVARGMVPAVRVVESATLEADDFITLLASRLVELGKQVLIISNDDDFTQLLAWKNVSLYRPSRKLIYGWNTYHQFEYTQINSLSDNPVKNLLHKIFAGCKTDNVSKILPKKTKIRDFMEVVDRILDFQGMDDPIETALVISEEYGIPVSETILNIELVSLSHLPENIRNQGFKVIDKVWSTPQGISNFNYVSSKDLLIDPSLHSAIW